MRVGQRTIWLFSIGLLLCTASYAEQKVTSSAVEKAGREWAKQWLGDLRKRFAKPQESVMHRANTGVRSFKLRMDLPFLNTPPVTGPLSFTLALGAGFQVPTNSVDYDRWLTNKAKEPQIERHKKIMADLQNYYRTRGYSQDQSKDLAKALFDNNIHIYYPLVHNAGKNLRDILPPGQSRNPYSRSSVASEATDYYNLGLMCQKVGNHKEAFRMYERAANRYGHAMSQASLAYLYETGQGVSRNVYKAMEYYHMAAQQGHSVAHYNLGRIYKNGLNHGLQIIRPDAQKAEQFLLRAAAQGIVAAYHQLGVLYFTLGKQINPKSLKPEEFSKWDKNKDKKISSDENRLLQDAHDHFLLAANQGHGPAQHALGVMYLQGQGVTANPTTSAHWLEKAVAHKLPDSLYNLAQLYENGIGVRPNLPRAFTLYHEAAGLGHSPSQYNLGLFYYQGRNAGTLLSVRVPKNFHDKHPAKTLPDELVRLNPEENAILAYAIALYRPRHGSEDWTLELLLPTGQERFANEVLNKFTGKKSLGTLTEQKIEQLGGDDPTRAYVWWKLAADKHQQAAIVGLELLNRILTPDQVKAAETQASRLNSEIRAPKGPSPMVQAQAQVPFQAADWSTGFFVSEDGYVITGKHLLRGGTRFQVVTENGAFPARALSLPGDLDQFLLLKVDGGYKFPSLPLGASHSTRERDEVHVLGYQLPQNTHSTQPRAAQATTQIQSVLGAQADPRFFTLLHPVLGDQLVLKFRTYLDDRSTPVMSSADDIGEYDASGNPIPPKPIEETLSPEDLREFQEETLKRLKGALRAHHILLGNAHISLGYQLKKKLWYDAVGRVWLRENKTQSRALPYPKGSWVVLDERKIHLAPPLDQVREGQALIRISVVPGIVQRNDQPLRLYQLAEKVLTRKTSSGDHPKTTLEDPIMDADFKVVSKTLDPDFTSGFTPGFRGTALLNQQGQAIGLFFLGFRGRTPDVFQNFSSYHRYLLKSDHLMTFLNRLPDVNYTTRQPKVPEKVERDAYLLAKAKASMVLVQVAGELPKSPPKTDGGNQP